MREGGNNQHFYHLGMLWFVLAVSIMHENPVAPISFLAICIASVLISCWVDKERGQHPSNISSSLSLSQHEHKMTLILKLEGFTMDSSHTNPQHNNCDALPVLCIQVDCHNTADRAYFPTRGRQKLTNHMGQLVLRTL